MFCLRHRTFITSTASESVRFSAFDLLLNPSTAPKVTCFLPRNRSEVVAIIAFKKWVMRWNRSMMCRGFPATSAAIREISSGPTGRPTRQTVTLKLVEEKFSNYRN